MNFAFSAPTAINFGPGIVNELGNMLKGQGVKRVFLIFDKGVKMAGIIDKVLAILGEAGIEAYQYDGVLPNPPDYQVEEAATLAKDFKADALVAIGGGSSIDTAKAVNILSTNPFPIAQYDGFNTVPNPGGLFYAIPTTAGTGSEVTNVTVITHSEEKRKMVVLGQNVSPTMALIDPELTYGLPPAITASTGMDALTHAIEGYVSTWASPVTDAMNLESIKMIGRSLARACKNGNDLEARSDMILASAITGICMGNTSLGFAHSMSHPMSAHFNVPHGVGNAIALPIVMEYSAPAISPEKMASMCDALGMDVKGKNHEQLSKEFVDFLTKLSEEIGIPRLRDTAVPRDAFEILATCAVEKEAATLTTPRKPTIQEAIELFEKAW